MICWSQEIILLRFISLKLLSDFLQVKLSDYSSLCNCMYAQHLLCGMIHMGWVRRVVMLSADMLSIGEFLLIDR